MNVLIISSASETISAEYLDIAEDTSDFLAKQDFDLVFGGSALSMMGTCYNVFSKHERNIYAYTTSKYQEQFKLLPKAKHYLRKTTFELKKDLFEEADLIVCLPGGLGTYSEVLSFLEEKKSNNKVTPLIIYNEYGFYDKLLSSINDLVENNFTTSNIYDNFVVVNNIEEFKKVVLNIRRVLK